MFQVLWLLFLGGLMVLALKWYFDEKSGKNFYKKYPLMKVLDETDSKPGYETTMSALMDADKMDDPALQQVVFESKLKSKS